MKKGIFRLAIVLFAGIMVFGSCTKKGEEDPGISFHSRTARLAGEWKLTAQDLTYTRTYKDQVWNEETYEYDEVMVTRTEKTTYDGTLVTETTTWSDGRDSETYSYAYSEDFTIEKAGTYEMTSVYTGDGVATSVDKGNWMWLNKNKEQDLAKKEALMFASTSSTYTSSEGASSSTSSGKSNVDGMRVIKRLANKELIFLIDYTYTNNEGETSKRTGTITYTQD